MNRRHFLGQVALGAAVASVARPAVAAQGASGLRIKFVGMMGYFTRSDASLLVAVPGKHHAGLYGHVPFLMARTGSAIAQALGLTAMPGVVAGAFDMTLASSPAGAFVYRCLDGIDLDVSAAGAAVAVDHRATQLARLQAIAPGKRLRNDLRRWAQSTITVQGGLLENSAAHPDAGKIWSFGSYQQALTDATMYSAPAAKVRLSMGAQVQAFDAGLGALDELWIVSAAGPRTDPPNPKRLEHGHMLFEFFADATPIVPTCDTAEGRITIATELPCASGTASRGGAAAVTAPPYTEFCPGGGCCN